MIDPIDEYVI